MINILEILDCIVTIFNSTMSNSIYSFFVQEFPKTHLFNLIDLIEQVFQKKIMNLSSSSPKYTYIFYSPNYRIINPSSSYDKCYSIFRSIVDNVQNKKLNINSASEIDYYYYEAYLKYVKLNTISLTSIII